MGDKEVALLRRRKWPVICPLLRRRKCLVLSSLAAICSLVVIVLPNTAEAIRSRSEAFDNVVVANGEEAIRSRSETADKMPFPSTIEATPLHSEASDNEVSAAVATPPRGRTSDNEASVGASTTVRLGLVEPLERINVTLEPITPPFEPISYSTRMTHVSRTWYQSILRQQQIISEQVDELRDKLNQNLMSSREFLDRMSSLFERTDRLYVQWKKRGYPVDPFGEGRVLWPLSEATLLARKDAAVGRSLNYLKLSLINFFLGYVDSDGALIDTAESQAAISRAWRVRSELFLKTLES